MATAVEGTRKVAFVTGASVGIGQAIACRLAEEGHDLVIAALEHGSLAETEAMLTDKGVRSTSLYFDVGDVAAVTKGFQDAVEAMGRVDVLVNNAAVPLLRSALEVSERDWDNLMSPNLKGAFFISQCLAGHLIAAGRSGRIVNIASTHGIAALKDRSTYGIAKAGLIHMTRCLAAEWAAHNITVNCVAPATISTPSREASLADPEKRRFMIGRIPLGRFGTAQEVAAAVAYLAGDEAGFTTGHTLVLDGGLTAI